MTDESEGELEKKGYSKKQARAIVEGRKKKKKTTSMQDIAGAAKKRNAELENIYKMMD